MEEEWKQIKDYEGFYEVSNLGRVKSLPKKGRKQELILNPSPNTTGYLLVQLRKDNKRKSCLVHRLVMSAFNPCDEYLEVNHKDFDIKNNRLDNLEWMTPQENMAHYWATVDLTQRKETPNGETHHLTILTDELVIEFRRRWEEVKDIYGQRSKLAREFGIAESTARQITDGVTWKHLL